MHPKVVELLALLDSGTITPSQAEEAIEQAGGLTFVILNLAL